jgi:hypothetical protein
MIINVPVIIAWNNANAVFAAVVMLIYAWTPLIIIALQFYTKKVTVSSNGIEYKSLTRHYFIKWENVKTVGKAIAYRSDWQVYFNAESTDNYKYLNEMPRKTPNEKLFYIRASKQLFEEIHKHWDGEIFDEHR